MKSRILTILYIVAIALLIITFSIGLPIYVRPFYYAHIAPLDLVEDTGRTVEQTIPRRARTTSPTARCSLTSTLSRCLHRLPSRSRFGH